MKSKSFFDGPFGKYVLPGIILQSVLIGGGFATGREIVEYGAKFGSLGYCGNVFCNRRNIKKHTRFELLTQKGSILTVTKQLTNYL